MESARFLSREGDHKSGVTRRIVVPRPAAGADWSVVVPGGVMWRALLVRAVLVTSAAVANRLPRLSITDGTVTLGTFEAPANIAAGATVAITYSAGGASTANGASGLFPTVSLPLLTLETGWTVAVVTAALDVADQWSGILLTVEEFYDTPTTLSERAEDRERAEMELYASLAGGGAQIGAGGAVGA